MTDTGKRLSTEDARKYVVASIQEINKDALRHFEDRGYVPWNVAIAAIQSAVSEVSGAEARNAVIGECAKICEEKAADCPCSLCDERRDLASEIRALKTHTGTGEKT